MTYEQTKPKQTKELRNGTLANKQIYKAMGRLTTTGIIFYLVKRHKTGLLVSWAVLITALYVYPPLPDMLRSLI